MKLFSLRSVSLSLGIASALLVACGEEQLIDGGEPLFPAPHCDFLRKCCSEIGADPTKASVSVQCKTDLRTAQAHALGDNECFKAQGSYMASCPHTTSGSGTGGAGQGTGGASGASCASLVVCCGQLTDPTQKLSCNSVAAMGNELSCELRLPMYVSTSQCAAAPAGAGGSGAAGSTSAGGSTGTGGTGAMSCGFSSTDPTCESCLSGNCCNEAAACFGDSSCVALVSSHCQMCTDSQACMDACASTPSVNAYNSFVTCLNTAGCGSCGI